MKKIFLIFMIMCGLFMYGICSAAPGGQNYNVYVDTKYYTINVPDSWRDDCLYSLTEGENHGYDLAFYDRSSRVKLNGHGGRLFCVRLMPASEDYTHFPEYDVLGKVKVNGIGSYNIIVLYPTDVQFPMETMSKYKEMERCIPEILSTISFKNGCTYSKAPIPFTE